jgi:hypothetical protein
MMVADSPQCPSPFLDTAQAARFLNFSPRTLEKYRVIGGGPRFRKFGSRVLYGAADLQTWADAHSRETTFDPPEPPPRGSR